MQLEREAGSDVSGFNPAIFTNYRREISTDTAGHQSRLVGLSSPAIATRLFNLTGGWPKRIASFLFVPSADGAAHWLTSSVRVFAWLATRLPPSEYSPIRWVSGPDKVSKLEFFDHLRRTADEVDWPTFLHLCPNFTLPLNKAKDLRRAKGFKAIDFRNLREQALAFYADQVESCEASAGLTIYTLYGAYERWCLNRLIIHPKHPGAYLLLEDLRNVLPGPLAQDVMDEDGVERVGVHGIRFQQAKE